MSLSNDIPKQRSHELKVAEPVERVASKIFIFAILGGIGYVGVIYGPKIYQVYEILNR